MDPGGGEYAAALAYRADMVLSLTAFLSTRFSFFGLSFDHSMGFWLGEALGKTHLFLLRCWIVYVPRRHFS